MNVEPRYLAADMDNPPLQYEEEGIYGIARMERRMSHNPHHPRVFSLAYLMLPVFLPLTAGLTWGFISMLIDNSDGIRDSFSGWAVAIGALTAAYIPISQGLWLHPGVDHDKVWTRFGPFHPDADITDPNWENHAQTWRNVLAADAWLDHRDFYDTHPQHLAQLNTLIGPPDHYDD